MKPAERLQPIADRVQDWARNDPSVQALFWYGSHSIGRAGPDSDLDAAVLVADGTDLTEVASRIEKCLNGLCRHKLGPVQGRYHVWCTNDLIRVDFILARSTEELVWLVDAQDVPPPRLVRGVVKSAEGEKLLELAARPCQIDVTARIDEEIQKFLEAFEACSALQRRSDCYGFYFHYNLALHRVVRLLQIAKRGPERLYLPPQVCNECLPEPDRKRFVELSVPLYLPKANDAKQRLLSFFFEVLEELRARYATRWDRSGMTTFLEDIFQRDPFYNVRDVALWTQPHLTPGRLFRASKLSRWQNSPCLRQWLEEQRIGLIIDLRGIGEEEEYNPDILAGIEYCRAPIARGELGWFEKLDPSSKGDGYYSWMARNRASLVTAIQALAHSRVPAVVHCKAGRDRTGCFIALVCLLLGVPQDAIADDYVASGSGTDRTFIERFMDLVDADGGPVAFLSTTEQNVSSDDIAQLKALFLSHPDRKT